MTVYGLTFHSKHNGSFWRRVFPGNRLHWNTETKHYTITPGTQKTNRKNLPNLPWITNKQTGLVRVLRPLTRNGVSPILTAPEPGRGPKPSRSK